MLEFLSGRLYETQDYVLSFESTSVTGKKMHSNSMFIKDRSGSVVGLLCINFDSSRYQALSKQVMDLCGGALTPAGPAAPASSWMKTTPRSRPGSRASPPPSPAPPPASCLRWWPTIPVDVDRLNQDEKMEIMEILDRKGVFFAEGVRELCGQGCTAPRPASTATWASSAAAAAGKRILPGSRARLHFTGSSRDGAQLRPCCFVGVYLTNG